jgi:hypothetical protein
MRNCSPLVTARIQRSYRSIAPESITNTFDPLPYKIIKAYSKFTTKLCLFIICRYFFILINNICISQGGVEVARKHYTL